MLPRLALVDPELTLGLPPALTASTGLDALTQLIEPYVSHRANPLTDGFCREGLPRVARALRTAYRDGHNLTAREDMALASLLSGLSSGQRRFGRRARFCRAAGWHLFGPAWRALCCGVAARHGGEYSRSTATPTGRGRVASICRRSRSCSRENRRPPRKPVWPRLAELSRIWEFNHSGSTECAKQTFPNSSRKHPRQAV